MSPTPGRLINSQRRMVGHCVLVETDAGGLVLIDTGLGLADMADRSRLGFVYTRMFRPRLNPAATAVRQIEGLGYEAQDVRHIVLTHLDVDHTGGITDFPWASVHVSADEHAAAMAPRSGNERWRYRPVQWAHGPNWSLYEPGEGERWLGFDAVRELPGLPEEILAIPLLGHTRGHCAIAVLAGGRWLLDAGDTYFHQGEASVPPGQVPGFMRAFERNVAIDWDTLLANQARLRELAASHPDVTVFSSHDPAEFDALARVG
ncbi:MAG: MBL fold metallo-hydrolase [Pseudonocardia sp.]